LEELLRRIEHLLLEEYDIVVDYDSAYEDSYYHDSCLIEMNSSQTAESCLCGLLHEASHAILGHASGTEDDVLNMELSAWEYGKLLALSLGIPLPESYDEESRISIKKYKRYLEREGA